MLDHKMNDNLQEALNDQINKELQASMEYYNLSFYFANENTAIESLSKYFKKMSDEEKEHADMLCDYITQRGGTVVLKNINAPSMVLDSDNDILDSFQKSLELEKNIDVSLKNLYSESEKYKDINLCNYLEKFLEEQIVSINHINKKISQIKRLIELKSDLWYYVSNIN